MLHDLAICRTPEPALFEELLYQKLLSLHGDSQSISLVSSSGPTLCFLVKQLSAATLVTADPGSGEQALLAALQCLQQQGLPRDTRVTLLSATPPAALDWLGQHPALTWSRCLVVSANNDYGLLIENEDTPQTAPQNLQQPANHPRAQPPRGDISGLDLSDEEQRFFSHL